MDDMGRRCTYRFGWILASTLLLFCALFQACSDDHGLEPTSQGIRGTVYFTGTWPDSIREVRVAVFDIYPPVSFLDLEGYSDRIPLGCDSCDYRIDLSSGEYEFIVAACRSRPDWGTDCVLGFFHDPGTPDVPRSVTVESGDFTEGIDIVVEFLDPNHGEGDVY